MAEELSQTLADVLRPEARERRHLLSLLQQVQRKTGYLPGEALAAIARFLDIPDSAVYSVVTFYNRFRLTPAGRQQIAVCLGTACHLAGGPLVLDAVERELNVKVGEVTPDGEFGVDRVACIGCCALAPVITVGGEVHARMTPFKTEEALTQLKSKKSD